MKLTNLNPQWVGAGSEGISDKDGNPVPPRSGVGMSFDCPCGCDARTYLSFANPVDGGLSRANLYEPTWERTGDTFETLTLSPSINRPEGIGGCGWHGWIRDGQIVGA